MVTVEVDDFMKVQKVFGNRCRGKFVAPGKFFPSPYCHNVTNANSNPNPNLNPRPNPNPNLNPTPNPNLKFNPILNLNSNLYCCVWE